MKLKLFTLILLGALAFQPSARTQTSADTNAAATGQSTPPPVVTADSNAPAAASMATDTTTAAMAPANPPLAEVATNSATVMASNAPAVAASNEAAAPADNNVPAESESIPLINFQDITLTTAIENLARSAGINYLLDPKIGYGQPDQNGQIKAEPTISIRWENVTAEQALLALLDNYDLQLVMDPRNKIARITTKDPNAPPLLITRVIQLKYASTSNMLTSVQAALSDHRSHVLQDVRTSQLVVVATEPEQDAVDLMVDQLDKPTRQVLIETKLIQVTSTPSTAKGINWSGTLAGQNFSFGNGVINQPAASSSTTLIPGTPYTKMIGGGGATRTITPPYTTTTTINTEPQGSLLPGGLSWNTLSGFSPSIGFLNADGVQGVLSFLNASYDAQVVSTPRVVTLDNTPALIQVTREFPVINITASTAGVSSGSSQISYSNIGTVLQVTPRITANDFIWLRVIPDVSSFFGKDSEIIDGEQYQADIFDFRHIDTQVMIPNANTLVMGGLIQDDPTATYTKVPLLGDIPGLGWAFRSESKAMDKDNLIIFITPTIVRDTDYQPTTSDFLASKPRLMREPMNPNSIWDSPQVTGDWSNPAPVPGEFTKAPQASE